MLSLFCLLKLCCSYTPSLSLAPTASVDKVGIGISSSRRRAKKDVLIAKSVTYVTC